MKIITVLYLLFTISICSFAQINGTHVVSGKGVFFFGPSIAEADSVSEDDAEALNDFAYYNSKFKAFISTKSIKCEYLSSRRIIVQYSKGRQFIVSRDSVDFGTILTDGKKTPVLLKYVLTDVDLDNECKEFFNYK